MLSKIKTWRALAKSGMLKKIGFQKEFHDFFLGMLYSVLKHEKWFDYLKVGRTENDMLNHFQYTEAAALVNEIFRILVNEKIVAKIGNNQYIAIELEEEPVLVKPELFTESYYNLWKTYAQAIPDRLKGNYIKYTHGENADNWEEALKSPFYNSMRETSFAFVDFKKTSFRLLDVGCGIGSSTLQLYAHLYKNNSRLEEVTIYGVEPDEKFLTIATNKKLEILQFFLPDKSMGNLALMESYLPHYYQGNALNLPFPDNTFDYVYTSHILYLTDPKKAISEMLRVAKPNGVIFGTQSFLSKPYTHIWSLFMKVIEGANGFFSKDDLARWVKESGGKNVSFATPVVFKFRKK